MYTKLGLERLVWEVWEVWCVVRQLIVNCELTNCELSLLPHLLPLPYNV